MHFNNKIRIEFREGLLDRCLIEHTGFELDGRLRGAKPLFLFFPLSFKGEGDTGGEVA